MNVSLCLSFKYGVEFNRIAFIYDHPVLRGFVVLFCEHFCGYPSPDLIEVYGQRPIRSYHPRLRLGLFWKPQQARIEGVGKEIINQEMFLLLYDRITSHFSPPAPPKVTRSAGMAQTVLALSTLFCLDRLATIHLSADRIVP